MIFFLMSVVLLAVHINCRESDITIDYFGCDAITVQFKNYSENVVHKCFRDSKFFYFSIDTGFEWAEARKICQQFPKADLMSVHNNEENNFTLLLMNGMKTAGSWIGLHRKDFDCTKGFVWTDGSEVNYIILSQTPGQPNCSQGGGQFANEHCIFIAKNFEWHDYTCNRKEGAALCKIKRS